MKTTAIVLAAGKGSRMKSNARKQYMMLKGQPVVCHSLAVFEQCERIDEIILVCGQGEEAMCREQIVGKYHYNKVKRIVPGGKERYHSVYEGLKAAGPDCGTVLIHDGARPLLDEEMIGRLLDAVKESGACVAGMPVKDTIRLSGENGYAEKTLPRERIWMIQTPQVFDYPLILSAHRKLMDLKDLQVQITDDAMVLEYITGQKAGLVEGSYRNIKITTPEDLLIAEALFGDPFSPARKEKDVR